MWAVQTVHDSQFVVDGELVTLLKHLLDCEVLHGGLVHRFVN